MDQVRNILASADIVIWIVNGKHGKHAQRKQTSPITTRREGL